MNALSEIVRGLSGIWGVLRFRADAAKGFENTPDGVLRSFVAAAAGLPIYAVILWLSYRAVPNPPTPFRFFTLMGLYYVVEWTIWPNVMFGIVKKLGRQAVFCRYIAAYNWFALAQMILMLPYQFAALSPAASLTGVAFVGMFATLAFAAYEWFIARHALEIPGRLAVGLVFLNLMIGLAMLQVKAHQLGL